MDRESSKALVLTGYPAAGKTSVGQELRERYSLRALDLDEVISSRAGRPPAEIIRVEGEEKFRELESQALKEAFEQKVEVLSVGGGAVLREENRRLMHEHGLLVCLAADEETLLARASRDEEKAQRDGREMIRPLLMKPAASMRANLSALIEARQKVYAESDICVWTDWDTPSGIASALQVERRLGSKASLIPVRFSGADYRSLIVVGDGLLETLATRIRCMFPRHDKIYVLCDAGVEQAAGARLKASIPAAGWSTLPSGEESKRLQTVERLCADMLSKGIGRDDVLVAIGGGVAGDAGGLLASLYMRGIGLVQVPTTIVAQVDSAIGGKTAVNAGTVKNVLGTFYPAQLVLSDMSLLASLPEREFCAGLAEVVKYGVIGSEKFFFWLEQHAEEILCRDTPCLLEMVEFCSRAKARLTAGDLTDRSGRRALLNFGHTVGHAVEALTGFTTFLHGEAVAIGMVQALNLGARFGKTPGSIGPRVRKLLERFHLPAEIPDYLLEGLGEWVLRGAGAADEPRVQSWFTALQADKKRSGSAIHFVFAGELGQAAVHEVDVAGIVRGIASR